MARISPPADGSSPDPPVTRLMCRAITPHPPSPFDSSGYGAMRVSNFTCDHGTYNPIASLMFTPQSVAVRNLFSRGTPNEFSLRSTGIFWFVYTAAAAIVAGSSTSAGLLVPILLAGAAYGRFMGIAMRMITGKLDIDPGIYALIGASSFFAGVTRMTMYVPTQHISSLTAFILCHPFIGLIFGCWGVCV